MNLQRHVKVLTCIVSRESPELLNRWALAEVTFERVYFVRKTPLIFIVSNFSLIHDLNTLFVDRAT